MYKLKFQLKVENHLIDLHFANKKIGCDDENAAYFASEVYNEVPESVIKVSVSEVHSCILEQLKFENSVGTFGKAQVIKV